MAGLQRPPIPQAPLVDPATGYVTREWWRWFQSIGVVVTAQSGSLTTIQQTVNNNVSVAAQPPPILDDPVDTADIVRQSLALRLLADSVDPDQATLRGLELTLLHDPLPSEQLALAPLLLIPPADPVPTDQLMMLAQVLSIPADSSNNTGPTTVAKLLPVAQAGVGARAFVTDANATTFASIVAGGGANKVPVYSDGTNWRIG